jgi:hypothetical protein
MAWTGTFYFAANDSILYKLVKMNYVTNARRCSETKLYPFTVLKLSNSEGADPV